ncbi:hypothetical protein [Paraburkholderia ginsengiterrae]|uniref:hypothetical protein n=1 Tax=Paraburkholderia ginsengiterrae TaxID=1462993 RepID=UPI0026A51B75
MQKKSGKVALPSVMEEEEWDGEKSAMVTKDEDETVNQGSAVWTRAKNDITDEQYQQFYQHLAHDHQDPLAGPDDRARGADRTAGTARR